MILGRTVWPPRDGIGLAALVGAAGVLLVAVYLLLGGGRYDAFAVADPCAHRAWRNPGNAQELAQQVTLSALDGAACDLHVSREELARAVTTADTFRTFTQQHGIDDARAQQALRVGLQRAISDAQDAGAINGVVALLLRGAANSIPADRLLQIVRDGQLTQLGNILG
ncbi:MAG: hypothetical protein U0Y82_05135 [Thermoleophilia bacterium]